MKNIQPIHSLMFYRIYMYIYYIMSAECTVITGRLVMTDGTDFSKLVFCGCAICFFVGGYACSYSYDYIIQIFNIVYFNKGGDIKYIMPHLRKSYYEYIKKNFNTKESN